MVISNVRIKDTGWHLFNLNVGGFCIRNCRWYPKTRRVFFPVRHDGDRRVRRPVVLLYGAHVKRLQALLESGQLRAPRDRRPCILKIGSCKMIREWNETTRRRSTWVLFNFTVRGFTILGCRWHPESGSIQLPVTFKRTYTNRAGRRYRKMPIVCAYGSHINRLRKALEAACANWLDEEQAA
jgi:hypothetical protein